MKCNWSAIILNDVITCLENCYILKRQDEIIRGKKFVAFFFRKGHHLPWRWLYEKSNFLLSLPFIIFNAIFLVDALRRTFFFPSFYCCSLTLLAAHNGRTWNIYLRDDSDFFPMLFRMKFLCYKRIVRGFCCSRARSPFESNFANVSDDAFVTVWKI